MGLVLAAALVTFVWLELLRVWLPSVIFIFGQAGTTPATTMGAFAAIWFLIPLVMALLMGRIPPRRLWVAAALGLVTARLLLPATDGGAAQLAVATAGVAAGGLALVGLAAGASSGHRARVGVLLGLAADVAVRAALDSTGLVWWGGRGAWIAAALLAVATATAVLRADVAASAPPSGSPGAPWPWLVVGPAVVLVGVLSGVPSRGAISTGWSPAVVGAMLAASHLLGAAIAGLGFRARPLVAGTAGAVAVALGTVLALEPAQPAGVAGQLLLPVGLGAVLAAGARDEGHGRGRDTALAVAASLLALLVATFLYYAAYDLFLPFPNRAVLIAVACVLAGLGLLAAILPRRTPGPAPGGHRERTAAAMAGIVIAALGVGLSGAAQPAQEPAMAELPLRVMLYNLQMGFDTSGRLSVDELAEVILAESPDIVVLNEVDRGWFLNGGQDVLHLLQQRLGMEAVFAPAADEVWGNGILTRLPVAEATVERLPRGGAPMARSVLSVVVDLADGGQLAVVGTHLHHRAEDADIRMLQARTVAATTARLRERGLPVALLGDLNAEPDAPELEPLRELLEDGLTRPAPTWPSWDATQQIDHVLVSPDLATRDVSIPVSQASDHLPVAVTLVPATGG